MIPGNSLSNPYILGTFLSPDGPPYSPLVSVQLGGIGISDTSQGLQYQDWTLNVLGSPNPTDFYISAPNTPSFLFYQLTYPEVALSCGLAFDTNMKAAICYTTDTGGYFWWYNAVDTQYELLFLGANVQSVAITLDDKRQPEASTGMSDLLCVYVKNNNLYFRQLRDRFTIEYVLLADIPIVNSRITKVGMSDKNRLQFYVQGNLYQ